MASLHDLYDEQGQSPWLDNLTRPMLESGRLADLVAEGVRGVTSNPTIFQKAISGSDAYDEQFRDLLASQSVEDAYWSLVTADIDNALAVLRPVHHDSGGDDGFVSIEVAPHLANDTAATITAARQFHEQIAQPNLMVKIPATSEGIPAIRAMTAEGRNVNITLIFGLPRYEEVIEAYLAGLEAYDGDLSQVHSVASFFVSRVDTEVDRRLEALARAGGAGPGTSDPTHLLGRTAVAQAKLAYQAFRARFSGPRWEALAARGAHVQRPLWASTSTKNDAYPDLLYVDNLIGPDTVNTLPDATLEAFVDHGRLGCTVDDGVDEARATIERVGEVGVDLDDVAHVLEEEGVASFVKSYDELLQSLSDKASAL